MDGRATADELLSELKRNVQEMRAKSNCVPGLAGIDRLDVHCRAVVLVGDRRDSEVAESLGFVSLTRSLPASSSQTEILRTITELNQAPEIHGILVQLPLPSHVDQSAILDNILVSKDVDGFHPYNVGSLALKRNSSNASLSPWESFEDDANAQTGDDAPFPSRNIPCTPKACLELLDRYKIPLDGRKVVVLGRSAIVGLPLTLMLMHRHAVVTNCNHRTPIDTMRAACRQADVVISAMGRPEFVRGDWIKPGAAVLDVGINFVRSRSPPSSAVPNNGTTVNSSSAHSSALSSSSSSSLREIRAQGEALSRDQDARDHVKLVGDIAFDEVSRVAGYLTPVPGGVGPMTVAMLMDNTFRNAQRIIYEREHRAGQVTSNL